MSMSGVRHIEKLAELRAFTKAFLTTSFSTWTSNICSLSRSTPDVDWRSAEDSTEVAAIAGEWCSTATNYQVGLGRFGDATDGSDPFYHCAVRQS